MSTRDTIRQIILEDEGIDEEKMMNPLDPDPVKYGYNALILTSFGPKLVATILQSPRILEMLATELAPYINTADNTEED